MNSGRYVLEAKSVNRQIPHLVSTYTYSDTQNTNSSRFMYTCHVWRHWRGLCWAISSVVVQILRENSANISKNNKTLQVIYSWYLL